MQQQPHPHPVTQQDLMQSQTADGTKLLHSRSDDALAQGLSSWISCAAILAQVAATAAVQFCCQDMQCTSTEGMQDAAPPQLESPAAGQNEQQHQELQQDNQAQQALMQVIDDMGLTEADHSPSILPPLKRRNSGKRNLHKPWTATEEEKLVRLIDQADYRKEVLNVHRLTAGAWAKIAHHLGRSGASGVQAIKAKYRSLKSHAIAQPAAVLSPDILAEAAQQLNSSPEATSPVPEGKGQKRSKLTACALAILGLQSLANGEGTGRDIMAAIQSNPALTPHLNWDADPNGRIRWRNGVGCALSAEKSGIFQKTGKKQGGQIVWRLDSFKAQNELRRHAEVELNNQNPAASLPSSSLLQAAL